MKHLDPSIASGRRAGASVGARARRPAPPAARHAHQGRPADGRGDAALALQVLPAERLGDARLAAAQRRPMAAAIGRDAGNRHLQRLLQKADDGPAGTAAGTPTPDRAAIAPDVLEQLRDLEWIIAKLREWQLSDADDAEIVGVIRKYADADATAEAPGAGAGATRLDRFVTQLQQRVFSNRTIASMGVEQHQSVYDALWHTLDEPALTEFKQLMARSRRAAPPGAKLENAWSAIGRQELIGAFGMLKGMGMGLAGMSDTFAQVLTKAARAAGVDAADPVSLSAWLAGQYDQSGTALFGADWAKPDNLLLGMNAADIGTKGGGLVWSLTMMGAGTADGIGKFGKGALAMSGIAGSLSAVEQSAKTIAAIVMRRAQDGTLGELTSDSELIVECAKLAASMLGALSGGAGLAKDAGALKTALDVGGIVLDGAQFAALMRRLNDIAGSTTIPPEQKEKLAGDLMFEMIQTGVAMGANTADLAKPKTPMAPLEPHPVEFSDADKRAPALELDTNREWLKGPRPDAHEPHLVDFPAAREHAPAPDVGSNREVLQRPRPDAAAAPTRRSVADLDRSHLERAILRAKRDDIARWKQADRPGYQLVKVVARRSPDGTPRTTAPDQATGYVVELRHVVGLTPDAIADRLGLPKQDYLDGLWIMKLDRPPEVGEFDLRAYTHLPQGKPYQKPPPGQDRDYPPGHGVEQWELKTAIPATLIRMLPSGQVADIGAF